MIRGRPFQPGNRFGQGRPKGSRNKRTREIQELFDKYGAPLLTKLISEALGGDIRAARLFFEVMLALQPRSRVRFRIPDLSNLKDTEQAIQQLIRETGKGNIPAQEGEKLHSMLADIRDYQRDDGFEARISRLEKKDGEQNDEARTIVEPGQERTVGAHLSDPACTIAVCSPKST